ncbi:hypothetical protein NDU88_000772 [Pleurodeles waltl]|uniref:Uncharacterized protein n=1 Tax=Pleurodeles waltl TaxID=8319 RepID=A0AAV7M160_PLEWA|nr:hypothetical protein NDU88_000772 [Pleurodeles waltl]
MPGPFRAGTGAETLTRERTGMGRHRMKPRQCWVPMKPRKRFSLVAMKGKARHLQARLYKVSEAAAGVDMAESALSCFCQGAGTSGLAKSCR